MKVFSLRRGQVEKAAGTTQWDLTNKMLYRLCREHPTHTDQDAIVAKIRIIGRVYAASIERRRTQIGDSTDSFYKNVGREILRSKLDEWIDEAREINPNSDAALAVMVGVHKRTVELFRRISGLNKRS